MTEKFLGVLEGGPFPGSYELPDDPEEETIKWPLPKFIRAKGHDMGAYVKIWESTGQPENKDEARGAKYEWDEHSAGKDLSK
jgi:hypothetical protein